MTHPLEEINSSGWLNSTFQLGWDGTPSIRYASAEYTWIIIMLVEGVNALKGNAVGKVRRESKDDGKIH